jgi:hypothetical protein
MPSKPQLLGDRHYSVAAFCAVAALAIAACSGCYDGEALVKDARSSAVKTRLAEIDFGKFRTTLPRDQQTDTLTELEFHIFGTVPRYRVSAIKTQLKVEEYRLRHATLAAVRTATRDELAEPSLGRLRERIEQVVNSVITDSPVKTIGFYEVTLRER